MNAKQLFHDDGKPSKVWYCLECKQLKSNQEEAEKCCRPNICECGKVVEEKYWTLCNSCRHAKSEAKERERFEKAEKITEWDGPIYTEGLGYNEGYFGSLDALYEDTEACDLPDYVWICDENPTVSLHLHNILDGIEFPENQDEHDLNGTKELQEALEIFNKLNESVTTWTPNYDKVYIIRNQK